MEVWITVPLSFVMVNVGLLSRYIPPVGSGEIDGKMRSLGPRSRTLGHKGVAGMYLVHLYLCICPSAAVWSNPNDSLSLYE